MFGKGKRPAELLVTKTKKKLLMKLTYAFSKKFYDLLNWIHGDKA